jgi:hypothetical protein
VYSRNSGLIVEEFCGYLYRACQEKYIQEQSATPVGYFTGAILYGKNEVFQSNRNCFNTKVTFILDGI